MKDVFELKQLVPSRFSVHVKYFYEWLIPYTLKKLKLKSFPSYKLRAALISVSVALSQTPR